jgi:hypothetical protein
MGRIWRSEMWKKEKKMREWRKGREWGEEEKKINQEIKRKSGAGRKFVGVKEGKKS